MTKPIHSIKDGEAGNNLFIQEINWDKSDGERLSMSAQNIRFTRNELTTMTVTLSDKLLEGNIGVSTENDPMTDGDNVEVGGGS
ncbi:MAG: hypothetical protein ACRDCN_07355 [Tannerellaceae bacterium]